MAVPVMTERYKGRKFRRKIECRRGHLYGPRDYYPDGKRVCRICKKMRADTLRQQRGSWRPNPLNRKRERELKRLRIKTNPIAAERNRAYLAQPHVKLRVAIKNRVSRALKSGRLGGKWMMAVGYSVQDLQAHLERQFSRGMSWANYGDWHIDHVVPVAAFNFNSLDDPEFKACWTLTNLRPLWKSENLKKSSFRTHLL